MNPADTSLGFARGPHPLAQHLTAIAMMWQSGLNAAAAARAGFSAWHSSLAVEGAAMNAALAAIRPDQLADALVHEARQRIAAFQQGVDAYRRSTVQRPVDQRPVVLEIGSARLLAPMAVRPDAPKILVIPSLINRWHILDLMPGQGLLSRLEALGLDPYVLDFGPPGADEHGFDLSQYVTKRLVPTLDYLSRDGRAVGLIGHCLGGVPALGLAALEPERVAGLVLLATPWDFTALRPAYAGLSGLYTGAPLLSDIMDGVGLVPADLVGSWMAMADAGLIEAKYRRFAALDPASEAARDFVLVEDWANQSIDLAKPVAALAFRDWPLGLGPAQGGFVIKGQVISPEMVACPTLLIHASQDRLVPPAAALAARTAQTRIVQVGGGHIGMIIGRDAARTVDEISTLFKGATFGPVASKSYRTDLKSAKKGAEKKNTGQKSKPGPKPSIAAKTKRPKAPSRRESHD
jgi:polyhydroxyalkanoate synthase